MRNWLDSKNGIPSAEIYSSMLTLLNELESKNIFFVIERHCDEALMVVVSVPGQRWEIEFLESGEIRIEKFLSDGKIFDSTEVQSLLDTFSD